MKSWFGKWKDMSIHLKIQMKFSIQFQDLCGIYTVNLSIYLVTLCVMAKIDVKLTLLVVQIKNRFNNISRTVQCTFIWYNGIINWKCILFRTCCFYKEYFFVFFNKLYWNVWFNVWLLASWFSFALAKPWKQMLHFRHMPENLRIRIYDLIFNKVF